MNGNRPVVIWDFAAGEMLKRLPWLAVDALKKEGFSNAVQELGNEIRRYRQGKSEQDAVPSHLVPIFSRYVEIWPTDYFAMERLLRKEMAREYCPRGDMIPELVWVTQDWLEVFAPTVAVYFKREINRMIVGQVGDEVAFLNVCTKNLRRSGSTAADAYAWLNDTDPITEIAA